MACHFITQRPLFQIYSLTGFSWFHHFTSIEKHILPWHTFYCIVTLWPSFLTISKCYIEKKPQNRFHHSLHARHLSCLPIIVRIFNAAKEEIEERWRCFPGIASHIFIPQYCIYSLQYHLKWSLNWTRSKLWALSAMTKRGGQKPSYLTYKGKNIHLVYISRWFPESGLRDMKMVENKI